MSQSNVTPLEDYENQKAADRARAANRVVHYFTVPDALQAEVGAKELGLVELTLNEELAAARRAGTDVVLLAAELGKESLRHVDDETLSTADLSADRWWKTCSPKLRSLVMSAYQAVHNPGRENVVVFLLSQRQSAR